MKNRREGMSCQNCMHCQSYTDYDSPTVYLCNESGSYGALCTIPVDDEPWISHFLYEEPGHEMAYSTIMTKEALLSEYRVRAGDVCDLFQKRKD